LGAVELSAPIAWQEKNGVRQQIEIAYIVYGNHYGFALGTYDPTLPVLIDPILQSTYLGGNGSDLVSAVVVTTTSVYLAGSTGSPIFPGTTGGHKQLLLGGR
jgi:hypothetical protein